MVTAGQAETSIFSYILPSIVAAVLSAVFVAARKVSKSSNDILSDTIKLDILRRDLDTINEKLDRLLNRLELVESTSRIHQYRLDHPHGRPYEYGPGNRDTDGRSNDGGGGDHSSL